MYLIIKGASQINYKGIILLEYTKKYSKVNTLINETKKLFIVQIIYKAFKKNIEQVIYDFCFSKFILINNKFIRNNESSINNNNMPIGNAKSTRLIHMTCLTTITDLQALLSFVCINTKVKLDRFK